MSDWVLVGSILKATRRRLSSDAKWPVAAAAMGIGLPVADAADKAKDDLVSTVSHELRTPLTSIHGFVELLLDPAGDPLTEQQRGFLATVLRGSRRLERLVDDLLLTAQLSTGLLDIRRTTTDLAELVRESVADAQAEAGRRELQLSLNVTPDPSRLPLMSFGLLRRSTT